jgi:hypothetical protein
MFKTYIGFFNWQSVLAKLLDENALFLLTLATLGDTTQLKSSYLCHIDQDGQGNKGGHFCGTKLPKVSPVNLSNVDL